MFHFLLDSEGIASLLQSFVCPLLVCFGLLVMGAQRSPIDVRLVRPLLRGVPNFGHTCYFGAAVSMLFNCPELLGRNAHVAADSILQPWQQIYDLLRLPKHRRGKLDHAMIAEKTQDVRLFLASSWPQCIGDSQQDVAECLRFLLLAFPQQVIDKLFRFSVVERFSCTCGVGREMSYQ